MIEISNTDIIRAFIKYLNQMPGVKNGDDFGQTFGMQAKVYCSSDETDNFFLCILLWIVLATCRSKYCFQLTLTAFSCFRFVCLFVCLKTFPHWEISRELIMRALRGAFHFKSIIKNFKETNQHRLWLKLCLVIKTLRHVFVRIVKQDKMFV